MHLRSGSILLFFTLLSFVGIGLQAATSYNAQSSILVMIEEFSTCRNVTNNNAKDMFVPTNSSAEWNSFINNTPSNVTLSSCCPSGFVYVAGSSLTRTMGFCVMAYEAKDVSSTATSQEALTPWVNITMPEATTECRSLGTGYDLITNDQWTTLARNIENVDANWSGGSVGSQCLIAGNTGDTSSCGYDGSNPEYGTGRNTLARHTLASGEYIWDVGGNVSEQVRGAWQGISTTGSYTGAFYPGWGQGVLTGDAKLFYGPAGDYTPTGCVADDSNLGQCGVGFYYLDQTFSGEGFRRGGDYLDAGSDVFFTHMQQGGYADSAVGFRCVYHPDYSTWSSYSNPSAPSNGTFESGDFTSWTQTSGDDGNWVIDSTTKYAGSYAAAAPTSQTHSETTCIERTVNLTSESNPFRVQFQWKVSSEEFYDFAWFKVDDTWGLQISGEKDWFMEYVVLTPGSSYTLKWCYEKDGSSDSGSDRMWLDNFDVIELTP